MSTPAGARRPTHQIRIGTGKPWENLPPRRQAHAHLWAWFLRRIGLDVQVRRTPKETPR